MAVTASVPYRQNLFGDGFTSGIQQFHIQRLAKSRRAVQTGSHHITLEPNVIALIITCIVKMQGYLFLRENPSELINHLGKLFQRNGYTIRQLRPYCQRNDYT